MPSRTKQTRRPLPTIAAILVLSLLVHHAPPAAAQAGATLAGLVWLDRDGDGLPDFGEPGLASGPPAADRRSPKLS